MRGATVLMAVVVMALAVQVLGDTSSCVATNENEALTKVATSRVDASGNADSSWDIDTDTAGIKLKLAPTGALIQEDARCTLDEVQVNPSLATDCGYVSDGVRCLTGSILVFHPCFPEYARLVPTELCLSGSATFNDGDIDHGQEQRRAVTSPSDFDMDVCAANEQGTCKAENPKFIDLYSLIRIAFKMTSESAFTGGSVVSCDNVPAGGAGHSVPISLDQDSKDIKDGVLSILGISMFCQHGSNQCSIRCQLRDLTYDPTGNVNNEGRLLTASTESAAVLHVETSAGDLLSFSSASTSSNTLMEKTSEVYQFAALSTEHGSPDINGINSDVGSTSGSSSKDTPEPDPQHSAWLLPAVVVGCAAVAIIAMAAATVILRRNPAAPTNASPSSPASTATDQGTDAAVSANPSSKDPVQHEVRGSTRV